jgi:hypothetical protein
LILLPRCESRLTPKVRGSSITHECQFYFDFSVAGCQAVKPSFNVPAYDRKPPIADVTSADSMKSIENAFAEE